MSFKDNLLKKIQINDLAARVIASIGPADSGKKTDKQAMQELLNMSSYKFHKERDLDLYISDNAAKHKILVSDNELAIYNSTPQDVCLRKSPTVKEMLNVFKVIKILNDSDVVVCKKEASVKIIEEDCIRGLDLSFDKADIKEIGIDGAASLESGYAKGVIESLSLFAELLGYVSAPKAFQISDNHIIGAVLKKENNMIFGPVILYNRIHNALRRVENQISSADKEKIEFLHKTASGKEKASQEGVEVFAALRESVFASMSSE
ncbi:MAG: hypothetical protein BWK80_53100 [Desulfobacteraceae bacterium IS3]|nr:MAG: hypothetical protein BWK80_53100 [Desulfobacteraceae bacterium IS3]